jgi:hypothetical protein
VFSNVSFFVLPLLLEFDLVLRLVELVEPFFAALPGVLPMIRFAPIVIVAVSCLSCGPRPVTTQPRPQATNDVRWSTLVGDRQTARGYINHRIRILLARDEYRVVAGEIHVWADDRESLPAIICRGTFPKLSGPIFVVGVCESLNWDGKWRSPSCDFFLIVEECTVHYPPMVR